MSELQRVIEQLSDFLLMQPSEYELSYLSNLCSKSRDTIRKHLITNYKDGRDYHQKSQRGKIFVNKDIAIQIRKYYDGK